SHPNNKPVFRKEACQPNPTPPQRDNYSKCPGSKIFRVFSKPDHLIRNKLPGRSSLQTTAWTTT
ncbi:hypothetical protein, partial [Akkermansia sp.]|uniref:hypothetical protein n=1 Tax=Akkermansia sp. TaxID=1872421 RepID=UPI0025BEB1AF